MNDLRIRMPGLVIEYQWTADRIEYRHDAEGNLIGWNAVPTPPNGYGPREWVACDLTHDKRTKWRRVRLDLTEIAFSHAENRRPGYLAVTQIQNGEYVIDHWSNSGDSVGMQAGPFVTRREAEAEAYILGYETNCEVQE